MQKFWCKKCKNIGVKRCKNLGVKKCKNFGVKNAKILVKKNWCTKKNRVKYTPKLLGRAST